MKMLSIIAVVLFAATLSFAQDAEFPSRGEEGTISITSDPTGSMVYLDAEELGKTPINMPFRSGRFDLIIMDQGIELVNTRFNVWANKENKYRAATKIPIGKIEVTTKPGRCKIWLDAERAGHTDGGTLTLHNIDAGTHVVLAKCGGRKKEQLVEVTGEETTKVLINTYKK